MHLFLFIVVLIIQANTVYSHCRKEPMCHEDEELNIITCDGMYGGRNDTDRFPTLSCYPPVKTYLFRNFLNIRSHAFRNISFPENQSFTIRLLNITTIDTDAFSYSLNIPTNSKLSVEIGQTGGTSGISLRLGAFNRILIDRLHFININTFNGRPAFDTICFGHDVEINELVFEYGGLTGFSNIIRKGADVDQLIIRNTPALVQLTDKSLPLFLSTTKSLEISNTGLKLINPHTFQAWALVLEELKITNNSFLENFPPTIVDGKLIHLNTLDLSYNAIKSIDMTYDWSPYSSTKHLLLRKQQLDLFLQTTMLQTLSELETIDFSESFISENNDDLIKNNFPDMSKLVSIDVSQTNLTEKMIIDLLQHLSQPATHFISIGLYGHTLSDDNFCSYFQIFKNAPNLLQLQLDDSHECNCVVDLFYTDQLPINNGNASVIRPTCLSNATRTQCDIDSQLQKQNCRVGGQNPDNSNSGNSIGNVAFSALVAGSVIAVVIFVALGFTVVYRIRSRRNTDVVMEQPIENPLAAIIVERTQTR